MNLREFYQVFNLINKYDLLALLSSDYCEGDEDNFKKLYGMSFATANKLLEEFFVFCKNVIKKEDTNQNKQIAELQEKLDSYIKEHTLLMDKLHRRNLLVRDKDAKIKKAIETAEKMKAFIIEHKLYDEWLAYFLPTKGIVFQDPGSPYGDDVLSDVNIDKINRGLND